MTVQELKQLARGKGLELFRFKMHQGRSSYPLFFIKTATGRLLNDGGSLDMEEAVEFVERNQGLKVKK